MRPILSLDMASLKNEFVHGYHDGAAMFYLSITNEGGQIEKVMDEDLASWGPYWRVVNAQFEEFLSNVIGLKELRDVKFSVCDGYHRRQVWMNVISRLHSTDPSWYYMVNSFVLETQGKLRVVMLAMHDINKISSKLLIFQLFLL